MRHLALLVMMGCTHFGVQTPETFVELDDQTDYDYRSTSAHGVVLAVREIPNEPEGNLAFWADAIRDRIRMNGGYALLDEQEVEASGRRGLQMRFGRDVDGSSYHYWLTLFVSDAHIHIVEAGGVAERFAEAEGVVSDAIAALRL